MTKYVDLIMCPKLIKSDHEVMRVFADFIQRNQLLGDVLCNEDLNVLSNHLVDLYFLLGEWLGLFNKVVDVAEWEMNYPLSSLWLVRIEELSLSKRSIKMTLILSKPLLMTFRNSWTFYL